MFNASLCHYRPLSKTDKVAFRTSGGFALTTEGEHPASTSGGGYSLIGKSTSTAQKRAEWFERKEARRQKVKRLIEEVCAELLEDLDERISNIVEEEV